MSPVHLKMEANAADLHTCPFQSNIPSHSRPLRGHILPAGLAASPWKTRTPPGFLQHALVIIGLWANRLCCAHSLVTGSSALWLSSLLQQLMKYHLQATSATCLPHQTTTLSKSYWWHRSREQRALREQELNPPYPPSQILKASARLDWVQVLALKESSSRKSTTIW